MHKLGRFLHSSKDGLLVVRTHDACKVSKGGAIFTKKGEKIGSVSEVFGPIEKPYISVRSSKSLEEGEEVYA